MNVTIDDLYRIIGRLTVENEVLRGLLPKPEPAKPE